MDNLKFFIVSDRKESIKNVTIHFTTFLFFGGFEPIYQVYLNIPEIPALSAFEIPFKQEWKAFKTTIRRNKFYTNDFTFNDFLFQAKFINVSKTYSATLLPDKFYQTKKFGIVSLEYLKNISKGYLIRLNSTNIQPLVWIDLKSDIKSTGIIFYFDHNGFAMTKPKISINLHIYENPKNVMLKINDFIVKVL